MNSIEKIRIIQDDVIDLKAIIRLCWSRRKLIIGIASAATFVSVIIALVLTPLYKSTLTVYPSVSTSGSALNQLQGLAANFGFSMGGAETLFSIEDIVRSRRLRHLLLDQEWRSKDFDELIQLTTYWEINDTTGVSFNPIVWMKGWLSEEDTGGQAKAAKWREDALEILAERIKVREGKSGLVVINVWMEEPQLASDVVNYIYEAIHDYTVNEHITQARIAREFTEQRKDEVKANLTSAEDALMNFRDVNRGIVDSPKLETILGRLAREVEIQQQVYITLQQQYEVARIEEVKETPAVIILDRGEPAVEKDKPSRRKIVIFGTILGGMIGMGIVIGREVIFELRDQA